ncbi:MAG: zinc ribbon domain-containing protein [Eggerthellaceae bacterium]|nr:zinc ribbon domain-containing protein [Eggerthellaceae bacterium]
MDGSTLGIIVVVIFVVVVLVIRYFVSAGVNKASDAVQNAWAKKKAESSPNEQVSLADRYGQAQANPGGTTCPQCGNNLPDGTKFCNKCGASLGDDV